MELLLNHQVRRALFGLWCIAWLVVAGLMLAPLRSPVDVSHADLIAHFAVFACLAFATVGFSRRGAELSLLAAATIAGGVGLELAQGLVPHRTVDVLDMVANTLGVMVGYAGALTLLLLVIRPAAEARQAEGVADA